MHCMPVLSLVYFRNLALLSEPCKARSLDVSVADVLRTWLTSGCCGLLEGCEPRSAGDGVAVSIKVFSTSGG
jgi:hypothetical protein